MEDSEVPGSGRNEMQIYLHKLYLQQFAELKKLKADRKLDSGQKIKAKRLIVVKYKALRTKASVMFPNESET